MLKNIAFASILLASPAFADTICPNAETPLKCDGSVGTGIYCRFADGSIIRNPPILFRKRLRGPMLSILRGEPDRRGTLHAERDEAVLGREQRHMRAP